MQQRYLEDFAVGQVYGTERLRIDAERIKGFAAEFDPQPYHLDNEAARNTIFAGLAASGWHTAMAHCCGNHAIDGGRRAQACRWDHRAGI